MERAIFGASEFFSQKAFITSVRGIEEIRIDHFRKAKLDIVEIWFNPWKVTYIELLELFFDLHDPTYRKENQSLIFFSTQHQLALAKQKKNELQHILKDKLITQITPAPRYIPDEFTRTVLA